MSVADAHHRDRDLDDELEITELVRRFYQDVAQDDVLGPMFNNVARVAWDEHLPKLTAFWCRILLSQPGYAGNPYRAHLEVHARRSFTVEQFERWLELFHDHVDLGWAGPKAEQAKAFARRVAMVHSKAIIGTPVRHPDGEVDLAVPVGHPRASSIPVRLTPAP